MPSSSDSTPKIYEQSFFTAGAKMPKDAESVQEVTFRFLLDGAQFHEEAAAVKSERGQKIANCKVQAPMVPDDKSSALLEWHLFYDVTHEDGSVEKLQDLSAGRFEVYPATARLAVKRASDDQPFGGFQFKVFQQGQQVGAVQRTMTSDVTNAKGETIPAGTAEFNLDLFQGFRVVPHSTFALTEETVLTGRKREAKGTFRFRAAFLTPGAGRIRQYVNSAPIQGGQSGFGHELICEVGIHPEDRSFMGPDETAEVHFRATYGPEAGQPVAKSERNDSANPTKVVKASESDTSATIEEKEANKKYQGKLTLSGGAGRFKIGLGKAGGDTCTVEISGSDKFLTDELVAPDATLSIENWRQVHYELMVPDEMKGRMLTAGSGGPGGPEFVLAPEDEQKLEQLGRQLFIEFVHDATHTFQASVHGARGTVALGQFLQLEGLEATPVYILTGYNWRNLPAETAWRDEHAGKTAHLHLCDALFKWRTDTEEPQAAPQDFSGSVTEATGWIDTEAKFSGFYMPTSGFDGGDGVTDIRWAADITKDDPACQYTVTLTVEEARDPGEALLNLPVVLEAKALPAAPALLELYRLGYPQLQVVNRPKLVSDEDPDNGKILVKEPVLGKELDLTFKAVPAAGIAEGEVMDDYAMVTEAMDGQLEGFFKELFSSGKEKLTISEEVNVFNIELHGKSGDPVLESRFSQVLWAVEGAYNRTYGHDKHAFKAELSEEHVARLKVFVKGLVEDKSRLVELQGKALVLLTAPESHGQGEDECVAAVKSKVQEIFDVPANTKFAYHPGLTDAGEPREGSFSLSEIADPSRSTYKAWHFALSQGLKDGTLGPGAFVGAEKSQQKCPVKLEFSFQPHKRSDGEAAGSLGAWVCSPLKRSANLVRTLLKVFDEVTDEAGLAHGHGDQGSPGDCLAESLTVCDPCVLYGRSRDLTSMR